jgi:NADP-dependent 3-hydroxy acid dehydrogenase YdfG
MAVGLINGWAIATDLRETSRLPHPFSLDGMAVFVTGAANGMGAGVSRVLHAAGATVVLSGRDVSALEAVAAELPGSHVIALRRDR